MGAIVRRLEEDWPRRVVPHKLPACLAGTQIGVEQYVAALALVFVPCPNAIQHMPIKVFLRTLSRTVFLNEGASWQAPITNRLHAEATARPLCALRNRRIAAIAAPDHYATPTCYSNTDNSL